VGEVSTPSRCCERNIRNSILIIKSIRWKVADKNVFYSSNLLYNKNMILSSSAFQDGGHIPPKFTCDGWDVNPELHIQYVPEGAKSLALLVEDPDSPKPNFLHWLVWNINPKTEFIKEESKPPGSVEAINGFGNPGYGGPCPHQGEHHYVWRLFALDCILPQDAQFTRDSFLEYINGHILEEANLTALYKRA